MEPRTKRIRIDSEQDEFNMFEVLPEKIVIKILNCARVSDIRNLALVNKQFYEIISDFRWNHTYLYIHHLKPEDLDALLDTKRKFNEIFFYGKQLPTDVTAILNKFGEKISILIFAKNDLKFMKTPWTVISEWLSSTPNVTELNLLNIEIERPKKDDAISRVLLKNLKKLKCYDAFLNQLVGPNLDKLELEVIDELTSIKVESINKFVKNHFKITDFSLRVYCDVDDFVQDVPLELDHLKLKKFKLVEFRYNPRDVARIISKQKELVKLQLEDGSLTIEDRAYIRTLKPVFDEILHIKSLDKLLIEMPAVDFLKKVQNLPNLKRLSVANFPQSELKLLKDMRAPYLQKLCIENIEYGKKGIEKNDIPHLKGIMGSLHTLKIDTAPLFVMQELLSELKDLKVLKFIRNTEVAKKHRQMIGENIPLPTTSLEKIICDTDDFKLRILPIAKVSPNLNHIKIYWDKKHTSFVSIAFDIIKVCPKIQTIEFKHDATFVKEDMLSSDEKHFTFSRNNMHFEAMVLRKEAKIICRRI